ncbi:hypothetical protein GCM10011332_26180 [Terasakiella brassicae]|uniref:Peptidase A2 domain-containing protein n=1 Tax=Terasakiella brassicae TaxID=1634917 RepID=A0A917C4Z0_9PROT|nr:aspartyl protease family protein [Terasakiella brassicae]GGF70951.1 hypothetical protein GCM10011332_26180 [Terasakiella brassicae]
MSIILDGSLVKGFPLLKVNAINVSDKTKSVEINALIDTGANFHCIDNSLANKLGMLSLGPRTNKGMSGLASSQAYNGVLMAKLHSGSNEQFNNWKAFRATGLKSSKTLPKTEPFDGLFGVDMAGLSCGALAIIGVNYLADKKFIYDGPNSSWTIEQ